MNQNQYNIVLSELRTVPPRLAKSTPLQHRQAETGTLNARPAPISTDETTSQPDPQRQHHVICAISAARNSKTADYWLLILRTGTHLDPSTTSPPVVLHQRRCQTFRQKRPSLFPHTFSFTAVGSFLDSSLIHLRLHNSAYAPAR